MHLAAKVASIFGAIYFPTLRAFNFRYRLSPVRLHMPLTTNMTDESLLSIGNTSTHSWWIFQPVILVSGRLNHLHVSHWRCVYMTLCHFNKPLQWWLHVPYFDKRVFGRLWILRVCLKNRDTTSPKTAVVYILEHGVHFDVTWTI